ncbi:MAG: hypothetical protein GF353_23475 [Candidatus Lokiarchaeota archaeon]|nr:hypothetical protein [Candidatus Lokiarchaeota archaeon]
MGFSVKEITYKNKYIVYLAEQTLSGPWFSFKLKGKNLGMVSVILKNIEPTPIYKLVNSRTGTAIDRITLDFDVREYIKKLLKENIIEPFEFDNEEAIIRVYIDIFKRPKVPYINTFFTFKNKSNYDLIDFTMYLVFDFDINGLEGFDNDMSGYSDENNIIYQYDDTGLHAGFSTISKPTHYESCLSREFDINENNFDLSNNLYNGKGEILSALQIEFMTLRPGNTFQTAMVLSGGFDKEELFQNIKEGKINAMKFLSQVNRSVKSAQRNKQEVGFIKINQQKSEGCGET